MNQDLKGIGYDGRKELPIYKWHSFKAFTPDNRQKLPPERKFVLVRVKNLDRCFPDPVCVGYLKYHAGVKSEPYFVTPGCTLEKSPAGDERVVEWCDCLPDGFVWYKEQLPKVKNETT